MKFHRRGVLVASLMLFFVVLPLKAGPTPPRMGRSHDPIQVPGDLLTKLLGRSLENFRLFAYRDGALKQIVHQVDERTPSGVFIMDLGEGQNRSLHNNKLDPQDFLVFRLGDSGDQAPASAYPSADTVEIELEDPEQGGRSYVYLASFAEKAPPLLKEYAVVLEHWDPWEKPDWPFIVRGLSYRIEGLVNFIGGKYYKTAVNKVFRVPKSAGGTDVNILDGQRMRAYCELKFGVYRVESNEKNMIGGINSLRHSYVRGYGRQWMTVALPLGLEGPRIYSDVFTYDRVIVSPMLLNIPMNPDMIISKAGIEFGYDLNPNAFGMRFYSPNCLEGVTIDGKMSEREKKMSTAWVPWYLITGPQGSLLFRVDIDRALVAQTNNKLTFIDDLTKLNPPEDSPGSIGYARSTIELSSVKSGRYSFQIEWYFPPNLYRPGGYDKQELQEFLNIKDKPVIIRVGGKSVKNAALRPPPLLPRT
jgi:hypothetical protein